MPTGFDLKGSVLTKAAGIGSKESPTMYVPTYSGGNLSSLVLLENKGRG